MEVVESMNSWNCWIPVGVGFVVEKSIEDLHHWLVDSVEGFWRRWVGMSCCICWQSCNINVWKSLVLRRIFVGLTLEASMGFQIKLLFIQRLRRWRGLNALNYIILIFLTVLVMKYNIINRQLKNRRIRMKSSQSLLHFNRHLCNRYIFVEWVLIE